MIVKKKKQNRGYNLWHLPDGPQLQATLACLGENNNR